jgi:hypothetical protein
LSLITKIMSLDQCGYSEDNIRERRRIKNGVNRRFKNAARETTADTPLKLCSPVRLFQEALMTIASVPDALGAGKIA